MRPPSHQISPLEPALRSKCQPGAALGGTCAVTGASGYVGSRIANQLARTGWTVRALSRPGSARRCPAFAWSDFELGGEPEVGALAGADALVHCAYDFRPARWADVERVNVEGSRLLLAAARRAGVQRIVLISTVAAFPGARSHYGRAKLAIERAALDAGGAIVRPGLVWGETGAATFGALQRAVETLPVVPLPVPAGLDIGLTREHDLAVLVERLLDSWPVASKQVLVAASPQRIAFSELLRALALRAGRRPRFVRIPWRTAWLGLRALEAMGSSPTLRSDSLLSLATADPNPLGHATDRPERYGVRFDPYPLDRLGSPEGG